MKQTTGFSQFVDAFRDYGRQDQFSYEGLRTLFEYIEALEEASGEEIELDVIAICCDFTEYKDLEEIKTNYQDIETLEDLTDHTAVLEFPGGIIVQNF